MSRRGSARGTGRARGGRGPSRGGHPRALQSSGRINEDDDSFMQDDAPQNQPLAPTVVAFERKTPSELHQLKLKLLNTVSASLIKEPKFDSANSIASTITTLAKEIAFYEPEFILKLALYTRDDLVCTSPPFPPPPINKE